MTKRASNRSVLRKLVREHPDWSYRQYAEALGQSVDAVRGALSKMGLSKNPRPRPKKPVVEPKAKTDHVTRVSSSSTRSRSSGYLKLM